MANVISQCHNYDPKDRPSIFDMVKDLRNGLAEALRQGER